MAVQGLALVGAAPAAAHTALVSATPGPNERVVVGAPLAVSLSFTEALDPALADMVLMDSDDELVATGPVRVDGPTVTLVTRDILEAGDYLVRYRVVGGDGHPVDGETRFTVDAPRPAPNDPPDPSAEVSPEPSLTPSQGAAVTEPADPAAAETHGGAGPTSLAVGAAVAVAALALLAALARRRGAGARSDRS